MPVGQVVSALQQSAANLSRIIPGVKNNDSDRKRLQVYVILLR